MLSSPPPRPDRAESDLGAEPAGEALTESFPVAVAQPGTGPAGSAGQVVDLSMWFSSEVHPYDTNLKSYLRRSFPSVRDVDDVVQESYLRVWRRHLAKPLTSVKGFLFTVARRVAIDNLRRERVAPFANATEAEALSVPAEGRSVEDGAHLAALTELLVEAVDSLPPKCRQVVILRKFKLLSTRATAERLGIVEHTVEMQLNRGLRRVRAYLEARGLHAVLGRER